MASSPPPPPTQQQPDDVAVALPSSITQTWLRKYHHLYLQATRHPFILGIRDGSLPFHRFKRWLGQDYLFVKRCVRFAASVLVKLPKDALEADVDIILGGLVALDQELKWFREEALKWEVSLDSLIPKQANQKYQSFLDMLSELDIEYPIAISAFWAIELVYCDSFVFCLEPGSKTSPELLGACQRWGSPEFKHYCIALQKMADQALKKASELKLLQAEKVFVEVLMNEVGFWDMSSDETD